jgi:hypothetical protein
MLYKKSYKGVEKIEIIGKILNNYQKIWRKYYGKIT